MSIIDNTEKLNTWNASDINPSNSYSKRTLQKPLNQASTATRKPDVSRQVRRFKWEKLMVVSGNGWRDKRDR